jgi:hypothetical protein
MWTSISMYQTWNSKNAELELGGPRTFPVAVCVAWTAELELGVPRGSICGDGIRPLLRKGVVSLFILGSVGETPTP